MRCSLAGLALLLLLAACAGPDYLAEARFDQGCWPMQDTLRFELPVEAGQAPQLQVDLTLDAEYRYQNLYLKLRYRGPEGQSGELLLHDELVAPTGLWRGERRGQEVHWTIEPTPALPATAPGTYQLELFHYMRDSSLCEVYFVGVARAQPSAQQGGLYPDRTGPEGNL